MADRCPAPRVSPGVALVPTYPLRLPFLVRPGAPPHGPVTIFLSVHDAYYLHRRSAWRRLLRHRHPDTPGPKKRRRMRQTIAVFRQWLASEAAWYADHGKRVPV